MGDEGVVGGPQRAGGGSAMGDVVGEDGVAEDDGVAKDDSVADDDVGGVGRWAVVMLLVSMLI